VPMVQSEEWEYPEHEELGEHETQPQPEKVYAPEPAANSNEDAEVVISEARQLFALADTDESGDIDEDELVWLIQELWKELGVKLKSEHRIRLVEQAREAIAQFGTDDRIGWTGFLRMVTRHPWRELLPKAAQERIPKMLLKITKEQKQQEQAQEQFELGESTQQQASIGMPSRKPPEQREPSSSPSPPPSPLSPSRRKPRPQGAPPAYHTEGQKVLRLAKVLFDKSDQDGNGVIDPEELSWLMQELWRKLRVNPSADIRISLVEKVRQAMNMFDTNRDGGLSFEEFLRMLCCAPWKALLPESAQKQLPFLIMKRSKVNDQDELPEVNIPEPGPLVLQQLQEAFDSVDADKSGEIDANELSGLVQSAWFMMSHRGFACKEDLEEATKEIMERYDIDQSGTIDFDEFLKMMALKPFVLMLPTEARDYLIMTSRHRSAEPITQKTAQKTLALARRLFKAADVNEDGMLEENELANVVQELYSRLDTKMTSDLRIRIVEEARKCIDKFDTTGEGKLGFKPFLRMLGAKPWCEMLPPDVARAIPFMLMRGMVPGKVEEKEPTESKIESVVNFCKKLFAETDTDQSGFIDEEELGSMLKKLWAHLGRPFADSDLDRLNYEVHAAMVNFDVDESGTLDFNEFIKLLGKRPWRLMLPKEIQDDILLAAQACWAEAPPRVYNPEDPDAQEQGILHQAQEDTSQPVLLADSQAVHSGAGAMQLPRELTDPNFQASVEQPMVHEPAPVDDYLAPAYSAPVHHRLPRGIQPGELNRRWPSSVPRPRVYLVKNDGADFPVMVGTCMVYSIAAVLDEASKQLQLPRAARRLFIKQTGEEIVYLNQILNNMELVASGGDEMKPLKMRQAGLPRSSVAGNAVVTGPKRAGPTMTVTGVRPWIPGIQQYSGGSRSTADMESSQRNSPLNQKPYKMWPPNVRRPKVICYNNDGGHRSDSRPLLVYSFRNLLDDATAALSLPRAARRVYTVHGHPIRSMEELENMMEIVVTQGEPFKPRVGYAPIRR